MMMTTLRAQWPEIRAKGLPSFIVRYGLLRLALPLAVFYTLVSVMAGPFDVLKDIALPILVATVIGIVWGGIAFNDLRKEKPKT